MALTSPSVRRGARRRPRTIYPFCVFCLRCLFCLCRPSVDPGTSHSLMNAALWFLFIRFLSFSRYLCPIRIHMRFVYSDPSMMSVIGVAKNFFATLVKNLWRRANSCMSLISWCKTARICICRVSLSLCTMSFLESQRSQLTSHVFRINSLIHRRAFFLLPMCVK